MMLTRVQQQILLEKVEAFVQQSKLDLTPDEKKDLDAVAVLGEMLKKDRKCVDFVSMEHQMLRLNLCIGRVSGALVKGVDNETELQFVKNDLLSVALLAIRMATESGTTYGTET